MAQRIDNAPVVRPGRPPMYPYAEWLDGSAWELTRGEDFLCLPLSMAKMLYSNAARRGAFISVTISGDKLYIGPGR